MTALPTAFPRSAPLPVFAVNYNRGTLPTLAVRGRAMTTTLTLLRLIGKSVVLAPKAITGPNPFACTTPHYKVSNFATDMIFQGAFGEMQSTNKAADPNKIAASLGFSGTSIRTLETGCEIDFHFVDATTAEIGLNNYVYTLKKQ